MRLLLIRSALAAAALAVARLFAGRQLSLFVDRFYTVRVADLPATPLAFRAGDLQIGEKALSMMLGAAHPLMRVGSDFRNRIVFSSGGKVFTPDSTPARDALDSIEYELVPAKGDGVSFVIDRSAISWPTPLQFNFMTGHSSSWRRHLYYRFVWRKRSGGRLEMVWRYAQWYYPAFGWTGLGGMTSLASNGLLRVEITPEPGSHEESVATYIAKAKGWKREEYRIENRGLAPDGRSDRAAVVFFEDETARHTGGGRSVELLIDRDSGRVIRELGLQ